MNVSLQSYDDVITSNMNFSDDFTGFMASTSVSVNTFIVNTPEPAVFVSSSGALLLLGLVRRIRD